MNIDPQDISSDDEAARIFKPIDDLLGREADELNKAEERIDALERNFGKLFPPAKRIDED